MEQSLGPQRHRERRPVAALVGASILLAACSDGSDRIGRDSDRIGANADSGNDAPVASFRASATDGMEPLTVRFDASASRDPDGRIVSFLWRPWGRAGGSVETAQSSYGPVIYGEGEHIVELVVTDDRGARGSATVTVRVAPGPRGKVDDRPRLEPGFVRTDYLPFALVL